MSNFVIPLIVFVIAFLLGVPVGIDMIILGVIYLLSAGIDVGIVAEQMSTNLFSNYTALAIPMFVLMANVMNTGDVSDRLFDFCKACVGKRRGALAYVNILVSTIFAGMSGSAVADTSGIGLIEVETMKEDGYDAEFSAAITAASSTIGPIIPPSIPLVLYAMLSGASVGALFLGGIIPGVFLAIILGIYVHYISKKRNYPEGDHYTFKEFMHFTVHAIPALLTPVILFAGIYGGVMTPTEASAVAACYAVIISLFIYRSLDLKGLLKAFVDTAITSGTIIIFTAASSVVSYIIAREGISAAIANWVLSFSSNKYLLLLIINIVFLMLGMILDVNVLIYVFIPLLLPILNALGINLVHFGIVITLNIMIGLSTPPYGMCLFIASSISKAKLSAISREILPMVVMMIIALLLMTYIPGIVTFLPSLCGF